jgi:error-prone DNA polymerase
MIKNGYSVEYAKRVFRQLEGFGSYGFPESHAASFALLVYVSSWIKCYYPDVFACALLNSLPMGFYQPAQIVIDARKHGVEVRQADINYSNWDNYLEERSGEYFVLRLGFRNIKGLRQEDANMLTSARKESFKSIYELRQFDLPEAALERLADADAFRSIGLDRRQALWEVSTKDRPAAIFSSRVSAGIEEEKVHLPEMSLPEHVAHDYVTTSLSLKAHPVSFARAQLDSLRVVPSANLGSGKNGDIIRAAGLILVRQRPGTASGICFVTIEDETGCANLVVFKQLFDKYRKEILQSSLLMVEGKLQIEGEVIHVIVQRCFNLSKLLRKLVAVKEDSPLATMSRADERSAPLPSKGEERGLSQKKIFPDGRNFR